MHSQDFKVGWGASKALVQRANKQNNPVRLLICQQDIFQVLDRLLSRMIPCYFLVGLWLALYLQLKPAISSCQ